MTAEESWHLRSNKKGEAPINERSAVRIVTSGGSNIGSPPRRHHNPAHNQSKRQRMVKMRQLAQKGR